MNHIYKTIWNKSKNAFDVVSEAVGSKGKTTSGSKEGSAEPRQAIKGFFAVLTPIAAMLFVQSVTANTEVASGKTRVFNANNGVQVIDIAKANNAGVSHNRYIKYNVDQRGQVLNNAMQKPDALSIMTKLAGNIQTNKNLDKNARVIINEVTGTNRSQLSGHIEIAGGKADLVIANQYGITCTGCGFINTDRATLTTGKPRIGSDGSLQGFNVRGGDITINGTGLNGKDPVLLQLLSRQLNVDGQLSANQLEVVTGTYDYDAETKKVTAVNVSGTQPSYAIDSTALGGIYADRISLISNENGVGVKMLGDVAATAQDFTLTASGKIELNNKVSAKENISIQNGQTTTRQVDVTGSLTAKNVEIGSATNNKLNLNITNGTIAATNNLEANVNQLTAKNAGLQADAANTLKAAAGVNLATTEVLAGQTLNIEGASLTTSGVTKLASSKQAIDVKTQGNTVLGNGIEAIAQKNVNITAQGNVTLGTGQIKSNTADLNVNATNLTSSAKSSAVNTNLTATQALLLQQAATASSTNQTTLKANNAVISGQLGAKTHNITTNGKLTLADSSVITATGDAKITVNDVNVVGDLYANNVDVNAKNNVVTASGSLISTQGNTLFKSATTQLGGEQYANELKVEASKDLTIKNTSKIVTQNNQLNAANIHLDGQLKSKNSEINSQKAFNLNDKASLITTEKSIINAATVNINGELATKNLDINSTENLNIATTGKLNVANLTNIDGKALDIKGQINSATLKVDVSGNAIIATAAKIEASKDLALNANSIEIVGKLISQNSVLTAINALNILKSAVVNTNNLSTLTAKNLTLNGSVYGKNALLNASGNFVLNESGGLIANNNLNINANNIRADGLINATNLNSNAALGFISGQSSNIQIVNKAEVKANEIDLAGKLNAKDINAEANVGLNVSKTANLSAHNQNLLTAKNIVVDGKVLGATTQLNAAGTLNLNQSSEVLAETTLTASADQISTNGFVNANDLVLNAKNQLNIDQNANLQIVNKTQLQAGRLDFSGKINTKNLAANVTDTLNLSKGSVLIDQDSSKFTAKAINIDGTVSSKNTHINAAEVLTLSNTAEVISTGGINGQAKEISTQGLINSKTASLTATNQFTAGISSNIAVVNKAEIKADDIYLDGKLNSKEAIITAKSDLDSKARIVTQTNAQLKGNNINLEGTLLAANAILTADQALTLADNSEILANQSVNLNANDLSASGYIQGQTIQSHANQNTQISADASLYGIKNIEITSANNFTLDGGIYAENAVINVTNTAQVGKTGLILSSDKSTLNADKIVFNGWLEAKGATVTATSNLLTNKDAVFNITENLNLMTTSGPLSFAGYAGAKALTVNALNGTISTTQDAVLRGQNSISITANRWNNNADVLGNNSLAINAATLVNQGNLQSNQILFSNLNTLVNDQNIFSTKDLNIVASSITNNATAQILTNNNLVLKATGADLVNAGEAIGVKDISIESVSSVKNTGVLEAGNNLSVKADALHNSSTAKVLGNIVNLDNLDLTNAGTIVGYTTANLNNIGTFVSDGAIQAGADLNITATGKVENKGELYASKLISVSTTSNDGIINDGNINTFSKDGTDQTTLIAEKIDNNKSIMSSNLALQTNQLDNSGSVQVMSLDLSRHNQTGTLVVNNDAKKGVTATDENNGLYVYNTFNIERLDELNNTGSLFLSGTMIDSKGAVSNQVLDVEKFSNNNTADAYFYNTDINHLDVSEFNNKGDLVLNSSTFTTNQMLNDKLTHLINGTLDVNNGLTNGLQATILVESQGKIAADQLNNKGLIFGKGATLVEIEANKVFNEINEDGEKVLDAGILSQGNLSINTELTTANSINNSGTIYAQGSLNIGHADKVTDLHNEKHTEDYATYDSNNKVTNAGGGGAIISDSGINIFADNFKNNYLLKTSKGNIYIAVKNEFLNAASYFGRDLKLTNKWTTADWDHSVGWQSEGTTNDTVRDGANNPIKREQIAKQGGPGEDNGLNAGFITEIWTLSTDLEVWKKVGENDTDTFNRLKNYIAVANQANIVADNGSISINLDKGGKNLGGQIAASGGNTVINIKDDDNNAQTPNNNTFINESIQLTSGHKYYVKYLAITDQRTSSGDQDFDVGAFIILDASSGLNIPTIIEKDGKEVLNIENDSTNYISDYYPLYFMTAGLETNVDYLAHIKRVKKSVMDGVIEDFTNILANSGYMDFGVALPDSEQNGEKVSLSAKIMSSGSVSISGGHLQNIAQAQKIENKTPDIKEIIIAPEQTGCDATKTCNNETDNGSYGADNEQNLGDSNTEGGQLTNNSTEPDNQDAQNQQSIDNQDSNDVTEVDGADDQANTPDGAEETDESQNQEQEITQTEEVKDPEVEAPRPNYPMDKIPTVDLTLPTTRYTEYVQVNDPNANYLVEKNPLFGANSDVIGSDYLRQLLKPNPDLILKRIGDDSYETYLIQQQLDLIGGRTVAALKNESQVDMIKRMFSNAATNQAELGLEFGKALTAEQLKNLDSDIIWMVERDVAGQTVLVPQVYLSSKTIEGINTSGAVIEGKAATILDVTTFTNVDSTVKGGYVGITSLGDIDNIGGKIQGDDVSLQSTHGSINNITHVSRLGGEGFDRTALGQTASIESKGTLVLDAAKDINNIGARLKAEGASLLQAGNDINIKAIEIKETDVKNINRGDVIYEQKDADGNVIDTTKAIGKGAMTTTNITHEGSDVQLGEGSAIISGGNTLISGSDLKADGQLYVKTGGDFVIESVQDSSEVTSESSRSGFGVGGGIWGKQSQETSNFVGTNNASNVEVGSIIVDSANKIIIEGSNLAIKDKDSLSILSGQKGVDILDGKDEQHHEKKTTTTTYLKTTDSGQNEDKKPIYGAQSENIELDEKGKAADGNATNTAYAQSTEDESNTNAEASAGTESSKLSVSASASAEASAQGDASLRLVEQTVEIEKSGSTTSVSSNVTSEGNLLITSQDGAVNVRGSNVDVKGALGVIAKELNVTAGQNTEYASRDTTVKSIGIYTEGDASAGASASANAGAGVTGAQAGVDAQASAQANGSATIGAKLEKESESSKSTTHNLSSLRSGGDMFMDIENTAKFEGANVAAGGNLDIKAKDIHNIAVQDVHEESRSSSSKLAGIYIGGSAEAQAGVSAGVSADVSNPANPLQANASASAGVSAEGGVGLRVATEDSKENYKSVTNTGNSFSSGGNFTRTAENEIIDQATQVEAGGNIFQKANKITDQAVSDSQTYSKNTSSHDARITLGVSAEVGAGASANAGLGATATAGGGTEAVKKPSLAVGVSASYTGEETSMSSTNTQAVTSNFKSGGSITTEAKEVNLTGTNFDAAKDINITADKFTFNAAKDTHSSSSSSKNIDVSANIGIDISGTPDIEVGVGYGQNKSKADSSTAVVGGLNAGGNINITTKTADFEGTQFSSGGNTTVSGDTVNMFAAKNTASSSTTGFEVGAGFANAQKSTTASENVQRKVEGGSSGGANATAKNDIRQDGGVSGGFNIANSNSTEYQGSTVSTGGTFTVTSNNAGVMQNVNMDNANATSVSSTMQAVTKKDEKSGFELGGSASLDSKDLRDARNVRDTYKNSGATTPTVTTERLSLGTKEESLNHTQKSVAITDLFKQAGTKIGSLIPSSSNNGP